MSSKLLDRSSHVFCGGDHLSVEGSRNVEERDGNVDDRFLGAHGTVEGSRNGQDGNVDSFVLCLLTILWEFWKCRNKRKRR